MTRRPVLILVLTLLVGIPMSVFSAMSLSKQLSNANDSPSSGDRVSRVEKRNARQAARDRGNPNLSALERR